MPTSHQEHIWEEHWESQRMKAFCLFFHVFLTSGNLLRKHKQTEFRKTHSGVHTFCRLTPSWGRSCIHSCIRQTYYTLCANTVSHFPPILFSYLTVKAHTHKSMHNNSAGSLLDTFFPHVWGPCRQFRFAHKECRADYKTHYIYTITEVSEKAQVVNMFCQTQLNQLEPDVTCLQPIYITVTLL